MNSVGFDVVVSLIYKSDEINLRFVHGSWRKYSKRDLSNRVVWLLGRRPS